MHTLLLGEQEIYNCYVEKLGINQQSLINHTELNIMYLNWTNKRSKDVECMVVLKEIKCFETQLTTLF